MTYALTPKLGVSGARLGTAAQTVLDSSTTPSAVPANRTAGGGFFLGLKTTKAPRYQRGACLEP